MRFLFLLPFVLAAAPAAAQQSDSFNGGYVGIEGGYADIEASLAGFSASDDSGVFGGTIGYRGAVGADEQLILGVEGNLDFITNGSDLGLGVAGIVGYKTSEEWMLYGRGGYARLDSDGNVNLDGFQFGGGVEYMASDRYSIRVDYRRLEFEDFQGIDVDGNEITFGIHYNF